MEDQTEILDKYILDCMLAAEATIHSHSLDDFSQTKAHQQQWKNSGNWHCMPTGTV
jgi:hypothetical protein